MNISTVDIVSSVIWTGGIWVKIISILIGLFLLVQVLRTSLNIVDFLVLMFRTLLEPVGPLLVGPWGVLIHGIVWAHRVWV